MDEDELVPPGYDAAAVEEALTESKNREGSFSIMFTPWPWEMTNVIKGAKRANRR
jgi:hypothetical protein